MYVEEGEVECDCGCGGRDTDQTEEELDEEEETEFGPDKQEMETLLLIWLLGGLYHQVQIKDATL